VGVRGQPNVLRVSTMVSYDTDNGCQLSEIEL
jgi:hypothetical protein